MFEHCERRTTTDAGPWVYCKLTYEPLAQVSYKGSVPQKRRRRIYQLTVPAVRVFGHGFAGLKVKVPAIPWGLGVVTNDWCINVNIRHLPCSAALWEAI